MTPIRIAFVGKGGAGKSVVAGTLARLLGRTGRQVLAVDSDPMPGLGVSLGLPGIESPLPTEALEEDTETEAPANRLTIPALEAAERYAVHGPDGVRFLQFGKLRGPVGPLVRSQRVFRHILDGMVEEDWDVIGDLPGGTRQPFFGWGDFAETVIVITEPTAASILTARRLTRLARSEKTTQRIVAVANKVSGAQDALRVAEATGLSVLGWVPVDPNVAEADRLGMSPLDLDPNSPAMAAVGRIVDDILRSEPPAQG